MEILVVVLALLVPTSIVGTLAIQQRNAKKLEEELARATKNLKTAPVSTGDSKAEAIILEANKKAHNITSEAENKARDIIRKAEETEKRLDSRERSLLERAKAVDTRSDELEKREKAVEQSKKDVRKRLDDVAKRLEEVAGLSRKEAEERLKKQLEEELKTYVSKRIHESEQQVQMESDKKAREIIIDAMQRSATDFVSETTSTTFQIENEELKGKIIGKEGRNIRTFERLTGVDIIIDEAPDLVTVSSFDPIRREVAALAIKKLLKDGRVHPGAIEETVRNIKNDLSKEIAKTGEKIAYDTGFPDLPQEIIKLLGRFKYRFSYGQNLVKHSLEMVNLGQQLAQEVGADVMLTKKACLLHDLGKVLTYEIEGKPHHHISGDIVRKYIKDEKLANAVEAHHGDIEPQSLEAVLVMIADAISGARPGARRDSYDDYVKRVKALEDIAKQYNSVKEAYAIHAGREVRVIVRPEEISDEDAKVMAYKIAKEIEEKQNYPGTVKVTVIREVRIEAEAK
jgi:ribonuclease Y